ncbi:hypothetical protein OAE01_00170 [Akkermansiaceae bacterium]|nr:hypothetical protein [Akkermansiaceae bacterium]MDB4625598.1 hypothetical protein [Akkermansiaceae bacterium]
MDRRSAEAGPINPRAKMSEMKILRLDFMGVSVEAKMSGQAQESIADSPKGNNL